MSFEEVVCRLLNSDTYNDHSLRCMGFTRVDGRWIKDQGAAVEEEEEHAEGESPSSPPEPRPSPNVHFVSEPEVGSLVSTPIYEPCCAIIT